MTGKPEHHPEGVYNLRHVKAGKRAWDAVGSDAQLALTAKLRVEHKIRAVSLGITDPDPITTAGKTDLAAAIKDYLSDTAKAKSKRTLYPVRSGTRLEPQSIPHLASSEELKIAG